MLRLGVAQYLSPRPDYGFVVVLVLELRHIQEPPHIVVHVKGQNVAVLAVYHPQFSRCLEWRYNYCGVVNQSLYDAITEAFLVG